MKSLNETMREGMALARESGEAVTLLLVDHEFTVLPSREYAVLHENNADVGMVPMISFLPGGGVDAHRPAFQPLADAAAFVGPDVVRPSDV